MDKNKRIVIFDFDGTLVDSMEHLTEIAARVMAKHFGVSPEEGRSLYQLTSGLPFFEQLATLYPEEKKKTKLAADEFEKQKRESYFEEPLFEDARETLEHLKQKGLAVIISSNSAHDLVERFVKQLNIPCDLALGFKENFAKGLPHFLYILNRFGAKKSEMVFVGDSLKDADKAKECGVDFIGKEGMFSKKDFQKYTPGIPMISSLAELKRMF